MLGTNLSRRRLLLPALLLLTGVALGAPAAASAQTFANNTAITINNGNCGSSIQAPATPYPSTIAVTGLAAVQDVNVTLTGFTHTVPHDVRVLLVGPQGQTTLLLHENGGRFDASNLTLSFDDAAAAAAPTGDALTSGSYKPSNQSEGACPNFSAASSFPAPAPAGPYGSALGGFNGSDPNGDWKLYVVDVISGDRGSIAGWSLDITAANRPPVADAGPLQFVHPVTTVTLDGTGSFDPDGDNLFYLWALDARPAGSAAVLDDPTSPTPSFTADVPGTYHATLIVRDPEGGSASTSVTVSAVNSGPVANAGASQSATLGSQITLNGSNSSDSDGDTLSYAWSFVSAPAGSVAALSNASSASPSFTPDKAGTYVLGLVVNDGFIDSAQATVQVLVAAPTPTITDLIASVNALQNLPSGTKNSLLSKLTGAQKDLDKGNTGGVCDKLASFIAQVTALSDKKIVPVPDATALIRKTEAVRESHGCD